MDREELMWFIEDNGKNILGGIALFLTILGIFYIYRMETTKGQPQGPVEIINYLVTESEPIKETFSVLEIENTNTQEEKHPIYVIDLYLKEPFIEKSNLESLLGTYTDLLIYMEEKEGRKPRGIEYNIYDRKIIWEKDLKSKGQYRYMLTTEEVKKEEIQTGSDGISLESIESAAWRKTTENTKKIDYEKYRLSGNFLQLDFVLGVDPLSDQEFEWFLKMDLYDTFGKGFDLYMEWDLGAIDAKGLSQIKREFENFVKRLDVFGDYTSYFNFPNRIKKRLVIEKPQFLYYIESGGRVAENDVDARSKLLQEKPHLYAEPIDHWLEKEAEKSLLEDKETLEEQEKPKLDPNKPINEQIEID